MQAVSSLPSLVIGSNAFNSINSSASTGSKAVYITHDCKLLCPRDHLIY
jgi:hypothetical protein